jgi:hypothetical protein
VANAEALKIVAKEYTSIPPADYQQYMLDLQLNKDHACLVVDSFDNSRAAVVLSWYVAPLDDGGPMVGSPVVNGFCRKMFDPSIYRPPPFAFDEKKGKKKKEARRPVTFASDEDEEDEV